MASLGVKGREFVFSFFQAVIAKSGRKTQASGRRMERTVLAFISFAIDHAYNKITQARENGIRYILLHSGAIFTVTLQQFKYLVPTTIVLRRCLIDEEADSNVSIQNAAT